MNSDTQLGNLIDAVSEAQRFIERAQSAIEELSKDDHPNFRKTAAAKRASMDLSNALVLVRKGGAA